MARIRSFKPEMVDDEPLGRCSLGAQLLFDRLIMHADDAGRFRAAPDLLRGKLLPYRGELSNGDIEGWVSELEDACMLATYTVRGQRFLSLRSFGKHQRLDNAAKPLYPGPDEADTAAPRGDPPQDSAIRRDPPRSAAGEERRGEEKEGSGPTRARVSRWLGHGHEPCEVFAATCLKLGLTPATDADMSVIARRANNLIGEGKDLRDVLDGCRTAAQTGQPGLLDRYCAEAERDRKGVPRTERAARETSAPRQPPPPTRAPDWDAVHAGIDLVNRSRSVLKRIPTEPADQLRAASA